MFKLGDYVVDSINGICNIKETVNLEFASDKNKLYFMLVPIKDKKARVFIPIDTASKRVRKLLTKDEIENLLDEIKNIDHIRIENDKELPV